MIIYHIIENTLRKNNNCIIKIHSSLHSECKIKVNLILESLISLLAIQIILNKYNWIKD